MRTFNFIMSCGVFITLMCSSAFAYQPLLKSDWSAKHAGFLPYEECVIRLNFFKGGLLIGGKVVNEPVLYCYSNQLNTEFAIPLRGGSGLSLGLTILLDYSEVPGSVCGLNRKTVGDFLHRYLGPTFNLAFGMATGYQRIVNKSGISLSDFAFGGGIGLDLSIESIKFALPKYLTQSMCSNQTLLINRTYGARDSEECSDLLEDSPGYPNSKIRFDFSELKGMRFVKIH